MGGMLGKTWGRCFDHQQDGSHIVCACALFSTAKRIKTKMEA